MTEEPTEGVEPTSAETPRDPAEVVRAAYESSGTRLLGLARWLVGDQATAEDVVHEAFARCLNRWQTTGHNGDPMPYLWTTVVNVARSRLRRRGVRRRAYPRAAVPLEDDPAVNAEHAAARLALRDAVLALPIRQREVVVLRFYAERSVSETAELLGISTGTVKAHTHRAVTALREVMEEQ